MYMYSCITNFREIGVFLILQNNVGLGYIGHTKFAKDCLFRVLSEVVLHGRNSWIASATEVSRRQPKSKGAMLHWSV